MLGDKRALNFLKTELIFLKLRGYSPRCAVPDLFFEDSPACIKRNCPTCTCFDCPLIRYVPPEHRSKEAACRYIPLDESGTILERLYQYSNARETEDAVENWLRATIDQLEELSAIPPLDTAQVPASLNQLAKA
jgi:hypothetical protein